MINRINYKALKVGAIITAIFAVLAVAQVFTLSIAQADVVSCESGTYPFKLTKSISDNYTPDPYTADEFKFNVSGYGIVNLEAFTGDTAEKIICLPLGTHTVEEVGPSGFVPADWTLQWSGPGCETSADGNGPVRPIDITVVATSIDYPGADDVGNACKADNQWRGETDIIFGCTDPDAENYNPAAEQDDESCTYGNEIFGCTDPLALNYNPLATFEDESCVYDGGGEGTGTIVIEKQTVPDGNTTDFSFNPSWSEVDFVLSDNERSTSTGLATGTYMITEALPANWTQTSVVCSDGSSANEISLQANEVITCVFTNTYNNGGGGDNETPTYLVFGYVWHDENESDIWEKEQENPEENEVDLDGWTVQITDGETTYSTTTDPTGYYYFYVPVGTWTISEVLQSEWNQTFPNETSHVVVVTGSLTAAPSANFLATLIDYLVPTAFAQVPATTYGPYDFGNVFVGGGSNNGGGGGSGGGSSSGSKKRNQDPVPEVLGDATSVIPIGAPNTGAGGAAPIAPSVPTLHAIVLSRVSVRTSKNG
jgi:hypothetical protein